jgi:cell division protein ZapE
VTGPRAEYQRRTDSGLLKYDAQQKPAIDELERLFNELTAAERLDCTLNGRLRKLLNRPANKIQGIYLYGSVGRGKTLLMDLFFHCLPFKKKKRQHFHRFMASVHDRLRTLRDMENPLETIADQIAAECRIICFDEFAVSDIADAMILGNLFAALFDRGVTLAATSNIAPRDLYKDGLQRRRFEPAIEAIEKNTVVVELPGDRDYRLRVLESAEVYLSPAGEAAEARLAESFTALAPDECEFDGSMDILGRPVAFVRRSDGVIWLTFAAVCDGPRSQDDYIELAREYQTVFVSKVPRFDAELENQARRFIALIDEFYDRKVKVILSADVPLTELYGGSKLAEIFERTKSRLSEMQSHAYFAAAHRP